MRRIGDFQLTWGESLRWDEQRQRLYFVDCLENRLHWLDGGEPPLHTVELPSLPAGIVLTDRGGLVLCLGNGLCSFDPDLGIIDLLAEYPDGMHGRANDATADGHGNLVTGTLNIGPGPGALFWYSATEGWRVLDEEFGNVNGPAVVELDGQETLVVGDTVAGVVYAYDYDGENGVVAGKRVLHDHGELGGAPDGSTADIAGGVWSCVLRVGKLARLVNGGLDRVVDVPMANPSDVTFGGPDLRQLYVTSIALDLGEGLPIAPEAGTVLCLDDVDPPGAPVPRFQLG